MRIVQSGLLIRHVVRAQDFKPDDHPADEVMAGGMRKLMRKA